MKNKAETAGFRLVRNWAKGQVKGQVKSGRKKPMMKKDHKQFGRFER